MIYISILTNSWLIILKEASSFLSLISPWESKRQNASPRITVAKEKREIYIRCSLICVPHFICRGASTVGRAAYFIAKDASVSLDKILFILHYRLWVYEWVGSPWCVYGVYLGPIAVHFIYLPQLSYQGVPCSITAPHQQWQRKGKPCSHLLPPNKMGWLAAFSAVVVRSDSCRGAPRRTALSFCRPCLSWGQVNQNLKKKNVFNSFWAWAQSFWARVGSS